MNPLNICFYIIKVDKTFLSFSPPVFLTPFSPMFSFLFINVILSFIALSFTTPSNPPCMVIFLSTLFLSGGVGLYLDASWVECGGFSLSSSSPPTRPTWLLPHCGEDGVAHWERWGPGQADRHSIWYSWLRLHQRVLQGKWPKLMAWGERRICLFRGGEREWKNEKISNAILEKKEKTNGLLNQAKNIWYYL